MTYFLLIILLLLISNNEIVLSGATYGLMLWYKNLLPLLLPFMLISGLMEQSILKMTYESDRHKKIIIPCIFALGLLCGYPIGAKTNSYFTESGLISKKTGNIILPLCNNVSPMFFLGFIITNALKKNISPLTAYATLFSPYIIILTLEMLLCKKTLINFSLEHQKSLHINQNISQQAINQITMVGLYVMLCSIITEFILNITYLTPQIKLILVGLTEITRGINYICETQFINEKIKTALILGLTSFGGISSILQTAKVIHNSGLSLLHYITVKIVCAIGTYYICLLLI